LSLPLAAGLPPLIRKKVKKNANIHVCVFFLKGGVLPPPPSYCRNGAYYARPASEVGPAAFYVNEASLSPKIRIPLLKTLDDEFIQK